MLIISLLVPILLLAQDNGANISSDLISGTFRYPVNRELSHFSDAPIATAFLLSNDTVYNASGDLRSDDPDFNTKSPVWLCASRVLLNNVLTVGFDRYVLDADYARIGPNTWEHNIKTGWEWDSDRFGMNFFAHPYSGSAYFNAARSNGYSLYESMPFAFGGSLMYEYFGENTLPSYNDLINTTTTGILIGEISYRLSSDFLDDRTTGSERFFRELFAAIINPQRAFSRLLRGRFTRVTSNEIYQKEPLDMTFGVGGHLVNTGRKPGTGTFDEMLTLQLDYGNPYEHTSRKAYDYFTLRADLTNGLGRKIIDNIVASAFWFGGNVHSSSTEMLIGGFQHYDFWDNNTFELAAIGFGPGLVSRFALSQTSAFHLVFHLALVPLGANSTRLGPDSAQFRDYNYGGGAESKIEGGFDIGGWVNLAIRSNFYWIHTYVGTAGDNYIGVVRPRVVFSLFNNLSIGVEHLIYYSDRFATGFPSTTDVRTEQKIFLQYIIPKFASE